MNATSAHRAGYDFAGFGRKNARFGWAGISIRYTFVDD
jgi:hypothetical protein